MPSLHPTGEAARLVDLASRTVLDPGYPADTGVGRGDARRIYLSPDGSMFSAPGEQGGTLLWSIDPNAWRKRACELVARNFTRAEWDQYLPNGGPYRAKLFRLICHP